MADTYFLKKEIKKIIRDIEGIEVEKWDDNRTWRRIRRTNRSNGYHGNVEIVTGDDRQLRYEGLDCFKKRKMPPYTKKGYHWNKAVRGESRVGTGVYPNTSQRSKEIRNNANRAMKKSVRQQYKKELRIELENLNDYEAI